MKRDLIVVSALAPLFFSCSDSSNEITPEPTPDPVPSQGDLVVTLPTAKANSQTRSDITIEGEQGKYVWGTSEYVRAFDAKNQPLVYTMKEGGAGKVTAPFSTKTSGAAPVYVIYPSNWNSSLSSNKLTFTLPASYTLNDKSQNTPMLGKVTDGKSTLKHLSGVLRINLKNMPAEYNTIKVEASLPITGSFEVADVTSATAMITPVQGATNLGNSVTVKYRQKDGSFFVALPVAKYEKIDVFAVGPTNTLVYNVDNLNVENGVVYNVDKEFGADVDKDIAQIAEKVRKEFKRSVKDEEIDKILSTFDKSQGSFSNVNYKDRSKTNWAPALHLENLNKMSEAYTTSANKKYYGNQTLHDAVTKGLQFWLDTKAESDNWWYNDIHQCKYLAQTLLKMRTGKNPLSLKLEQDVLALIYKKSGNPEKSTGANRTDLALNWIIRSCVNQNRHDMQIAINAALDVLSYSGVIKEQGFKEDGSFFQHGPQLYVGGYGYEVVRGLLQVANFVAGTQFAISADKLQILDKFMLECYFPTMRGRYMSVGVLGRSLSRAGDVSKAGSATFANRLAVVSPAHAAEYTSIAQRISGKDPSVGVKAFHNHLFLADYTVHVRPAYTFDVRLSSQYSYRCESGNKENVKGYFVSDGMTNIMVDGDEYYDIQPAWRWSRLPGITAPDYTNSGMPTFKEWGYYGCSKFAGGVNDGLYGATAYSYFDKDKGINTGANKSWFFFDDEVVCLGNVNSTNSLRVNTTINQSIVKGDVSVFDNSLHTGVSGETNYTDPKWVFHRKVGYVFPEGGNVWVSRQNQSGSWKSINNAQKDGTITKDVFSLGFNHADKKSYAYIVVPGISSSNALDKYTKAESPIQLISNTEKVQAVYHKNLKNLQAVFFEGNQLIEANGLKVKADKPCVVMIEQQGSSYKVFVADPARTKGTFNIEVTVGEKTHKVTANFAGSDIYAGQTKAYSI